MIQSMPAHLITEVTHKGGVWDRLQLADTTLSVTETSVMSGGGWVGNNNQGGAFAGSPNLPLGLLSPLVKF